MVRSYIEVPVISENMESCRRKPGYLITGIVYLATMLAGTTVGRGATVPPPSGGLPYCQNFDELQAGDKPIKPLDNRYNGWILYNSTGALVVVADDWYLTPPNGIVTEDPSQSSVTTAYPPMPTRRPVDEVGIGFGLLGPDPSTVTVNAYNADGNLVDSVSGVLDPDDEDKGIYLEVKAAKLEHGIHYVQFFGVGPGGANNVFFDYLCYNPSIRDYCSLRLSASELVDGDVLSIDRFRVLMNDEETIEVKLWLTSPSGIVSLYKAGSNGTLATSGIQHVDLGPVPLLTVDPEMERGTWALGCRVIFPETGLTLGEEVQNFKIR